MLAPTLPDNEDARLAALRATNLLDSPPEERFDRLTRLARHLFQVSVALVSLVDANRQWFKSRAGLDATQTPRDVSFCGHAILDEDIFEVPDAAADARFADNPLVTGEPHIRFYAGCPLAVNGSYKIGTLCLLDTRPKTLDPQERSLLRDLAHMAEREIAALHLATLDDLTQLSNRRGFESLARHALHLCQRVQQPVSLLYFDLTDFKGINDAYGHAEGDLALRAFADTLAATMRQSDVIGRLGGDEFVVLLTGANAAGAAELIDRLDANLRAYNARARRGYDVRFSAGVVRDEMREPITIDELLARGDAAMYAHKRKARSAVHGGAFRHDRS